jgi:hypothetical protein
MSETKYAEPWRLSGTGHAVDANGIVVGNWNLLPHDARRIVACVNACAGIETEALENGALAKALRAAELIELGLRDGDGREVTRARRLALVDALRALGRLP